MLRILLATILTLCTLQNRPTTFWIDNVEVRTDLSASYILNYANQIVPPDKEVGDRELQCLEAELKASGLFEDLHFDLVPTTKERVYKLIITHVHRQFDIYAISEISLEGFPQIDETQFRSHLNAKGTPTTFSLKDPFVDLENKFGEVLREINPDKELNESLGNPWIQIRPSGNREIKIVISRGYQGCGRNKDSN